VSHHHLPMLVTVSRSKSKCSNVLMQLQAEQKKKPWMWIGCSGRAGGCSCAGWLQASHEDAMVLIELDASSLLGQRVRHVVSGANVSAEQEPKGVKRRRLSSRHASKCFRFFSFSCDSSTLAGSPLQDLASAAVTLASSMQPVWCLLPRIHE
jgi:hypothetical protein